MLIASLLASTSAWALADVVPMGKDAHVKTVPYDPADRIPLVIDEGGTANITFDAMEFIQKTVKWDAAPFGFPEMGKNDDAPLSNNLPIVGLKPGVGSLVVITRHAPPEDKERAYNFRIRVKPASEAEDPEVTNQLTITYGKEYRTPVAATQATTMMTTSAATAAPHQLTWKERQAQKKAEMELARLQSDCSYGTQHDQDYFAQGRDTALLPIRTVDNGQITCFRYPGNMRPPAVFRVLDKSSDRPEICRTGKATREELEAPDGQAMNTRMVNDYMRVDETSAHWRLRLGDQKMDIFNCAYDPIGFHPDTGTGTTQIVRRVIQPK